MKKQKFRNAEAARQHRELAAEWVKINDKWKPLDVKASSKDYVPEKEVPARETGNKNIKSLSVWVTGTLGKKESMQYTGDKMLGVSVLHKSNGIPVFSDDEIKDVARMRR